MPTNVTPEYRRAEQAFREAREPRERLECLKEMLRTIPKHKGTEHVQSDLKGRIKQLTEELAGPKKGGRRAGPSYTVRPEGAAQICLIGPPNSGKSSLHREWTGSKSDVGPYPFTTHVPVPGMLPHQDVHFQLVDLPPVSADFMEPWLVNALQPADGALLVIDLSDPACVEHVVDIRGRLEEKKVSLLEQWPGDGDRSGASGGGSAEAERGDPDQLEDPFRIRLPTLLVATKRDLDPEPGEVEVLEELLGVRYPSISTSVESGAGLGDLGPFLFRGLEIVRVYTKAPGRSPDEDRPYTVRRGGTVQEIARMVHRDIAGALRFARVWGEATFDGQQVGPEHEVVDGDLIELHVR